jgi:recombination protein U
VTHANRGKAWESMLDLYHARYEAQGRAVVIRTPPPMRILRAAKGGQFLAVYASEGPPDYVILAGGTAIMAEAKQCKGDRWPMKNLHAHQAKRLDEWVAQGGTGVVLLHHGASRTAWVLPWPSLGPVWHRWHAQAAMKRRAASGTASLGVADLNQIGTTFARDGYLSIVA